MTARTSHHVTDVHTRRGVTLVELLVVLVLMGLAFAMLATGFAGTTTAARVHEAQGEIINLDQLARRAALADGSILTIDDSGHRVQVLDDTGSTLSEFECPPEVRIALRSTADRLLADIVFDTRGRCEDYVVTLESLNASTAWTVSGTTGWRTTLALEARP